MDVRYNFINTIKEKLKYVLGWSVGLTFVIGKIIEFVINWLLNVNYRGYGPRTIFPITIFYPIIFVVMFIKVTNYYKKKLNGELSPQGTSVHGGRTKPEYYGNYTWKDIFKDREVFAFYVVLVMVMYCILYYGLQFISSFTNNYAINSLGMTSTDTLVISSVILAAVLVVFVQNTIISWLSKTEKGNKVLSIVVFGFGIITLMGMLGINYLWENPETIMESFATDYMMGMILPIDLTTSMLAIVTLWFWLKALKCKYVNKKMINMGMLIAAVSFVISLTPLQTGIQMMWVLIIRGINVM